MEAAPLAVERDEAGHERVAGEVLFTGAGRSLDVAQAAGFEIISAQPLATMDAAMAHLRVPVGMSVEQAVQVLNAIGPDVLATANNVYRGADANVAPAPARTAARVTPRAAPRAPVGVLGIIDTGVNPRTLPGSAILSQHAFAGPAPIAREHGSLVVALAIEEGMRVHVADVFRPTDNGGAAASADSIAAALDWMIANNVAVINVSIEGPNNAVLAALVERAVRRGHVIVAAAGNGGPFARPAFPAAFEGSVAVTAIDVEDRPYMRANRGDYIAFAAQGVDLNLMHGENEVIVSGTSFAAPAVAARIATQLRRPSVTEARAVLGALQSEAIDLGAPAATPSSAGARCANSGNVARQSPCFSPCKGEEQVAIYKSGPFALVGVASGELRGAGAELGEAAGGLGRGARASGSAWSRAWVNGTRHG